MKIITLFFLLFSLTAKADLVLIGGGKRTSEILTKIIELANHKPIVIVPLASEIPDEMVETMKGELEKLNADNVQGFLCSNSDVDKEECLKQISEAGVIFFSGGDQNRLQKAFKDSVALKLMKDLKGSLHFAGTSAGTAIMSEVMLTGSPMKPYTEFDGVRPNMVEVTNGFGFVTKMIIDQHFIKRSRQNRLMSAVLDRPKLVGIGIDEATAIVVKADESFSVIGESSVMVFDARKADVTISTQGNYQTQNMQIHLLGRGNNYQF